MVGALGASYTLGAFNFDLGYNLAPVDWADGSSGRTVHAAVSAAVDFLGGTVDAGVSYDFGRGGRGWSASRATWTRRFSASAWAMDISVRRAAGLSGLDAGVPARQTFSGLPAVAAGPAADARTSFAIGVSRSL